MAKSKSKDKSSKSESETKDEKSEAEEEPKTEESQKEDADSDSGSDEKSDDESKEDSEKKDEEKQEPVELTKEDILKFLKTFSGVGQVMADRIYDAGFDSRDKLKSVTVEDLQKLPGIGDPPLQSGCCHRGR